MSLVEKHVDELFEAIDAKDETRCVAAGVLLLKGFLSNVERIANALEHRNVKYEYNGPLTGEQIKVVTEEDVARMIKEATGKKK